MATIKTGQVVAEIRGKLNGSVFSRNKGGAYVRQFVKPTNPNSTKQASVRSLFGTLMSDWRALTEAQRDSWQTAAQSFKTQNKVGDTIFYSGAQLYCRCNMVLLANGLPTIDTISPSPKAKTEGNLKPNPWETLGTNIDEGTITVGAVAGALDPNERLIIYGAQLQSPGVKSTRTPSYRVIGTYEESDITWTGDLGSIDVLADWKAVFGDPAVSAGSAVVFVKAFIFRTDEGFTVPFGASRNEIIAGTP